MSVKRSAWCTDALPPPRNAHLPDPFVDLKRVPKRCQFQTQKAYIFGTIFGSTGAGFALGRAVFQTPPSPTSPLLPYICRTLAGLTGKVETKWFNVSGRFPQPAQLKRVPTLRKSFRPETDACSPAAYIMICGVPGTLFIPHPQLPCRKYPVGGSCFWKEHQPASLVHLAWFP